MTAEPWTTIMLDVPGRWTRPLRTRFCWIILPAMDATGRLVIELPEGVADALEARVTSGEFANTSEAVQTGLDLLDEQRGKLEDCVAEELIAGYRAWRADRTAVSSIEDVRARLDDRLRR